MSVDVAGWRAARVAKAFVDLIWWVMLVAIVFVAGIFVAAPLLPDGRFMVRFDWDGVQIHGHKGTSPMAAVGLLVEDGRRPPGRRPVNSADTLRAANAVLEQETHSELEFYTRRWGFFYAANALFLPIMAALLFGLHLLRSFLRDVLAADVFTNRNARRLLTLGWLLIAFGLIGPVLESLRARLILKHTGLSGGVLSSASSDNDLLLVGLLALVIAAAWRYGVELQQERELTV
jgi:hypothetical protein